MLKQNIFQTPAATGAGKIQRTHEQQTVFIHSLRAETETPSVLFITRSKPGIIVLTVHYTNYSLTYNSQVTAHRQNRSDLIITT